MPAAKLPIAEFRTQSQWHEYLGKLTAAQLKKVAAALNRILRIEFRLNTKKPTADLMEDIKRLYSVNNNTKLLEIVKGIDADELPQPSQNLPKPTKKQVAAGKEVDKARVRKVIEERVSKAKLEEEQKKEQARLEQERMKKEQARLEEERKKKVVIKKQEPVKQKQTEYSVVIKPPKEGEQGFIPNFSKLTLLEQLEIVLKSAKFSGVPPSNDFYQTIAEDFYKNINSILSKSPYTAVSILVNKYKMKPEVLRMLYKAKMDIDFYPTGESAIDTFIDNDRGFLRAGWQGRNLRVKLLEGTSGIGSVAYWFHKEFPKLEITLNEMDKNVLEISKLLLGTEDFNYINQDFFKIPRLRFPYDIIFLNPPFMKNQGYFKFILQALKLLSGAGEQGRLYLICPSLTSKEWTADISDWMKSKDTGGTILPNRWRDMVDEISPDATEENNWNNHFQIDMCQKIGTTTDFGGTGVKADLYKITMK